MNKRTATHVVRCRKCGSLISADLYAAHNKTCRGPPVCTIILPEIKAAVRNGDPIQVRALIIPYENFDIKEFRLNIPDGLTIDGVIPEQPPSRLIASQRLKMIYILRAHRTADYLIGPLEIEAQINKELVQTIASNKIMVTVLPKSPDVTVDVALPKTVATLVKTPLKLTFHNHLASPLHEIAPRIQTCACYHSKIQPIRDVAPNSITTTEIELTPKDPGDHEIIVEYKVRYNENREITYQAKTQLKVQTSPPIINIQTKVVEYNAEYHMVHLRIWAINNGAGPAIDLRLEVKPDPSTELFAGMLWAFDDILGPGRESQAIDLWLESREPHGHGAIGIERITATFKDAERHQLDEVFIELGEISVNKGL